MNKQQLTTRYIDILQNRSHDREAVLAACSTLELTPVFDIKAALKPGKASRVVESFWQEISDFIIKQNSLLNLIVEAGSAPQAVLALENLKRLSEATYDIPTWASFSRITLDTDILAFEQVPSTTERAKAFYTLVTNNLYAIPSGDEKIILVPMPK